MILHYSNNTRFGIYDNCISPSKNTINYIPIKFNYLVIEKEFELPYADTGKDTNDKEIK